MKDRPGQFDPPEHFDCMEHKNPWADMAAIQDLAQKAHRRALQAGEAHENEQWMPVAVEVGVWAGVTTELLVRNRFRVFAVDHWQGNPGDRLGSVANAMPPGAPFLTFCRNMNHRLFGSVIPLFGTSAQWAAAWKAASEGCWPIDFLLLDAGHRHHEIARDIKAWTELVRPGGIIVGHDYGQFQGVTRAVQDSGPFERAGKTVWWREKVPEKG